MPVLLRFDHHADPVAVSLPQLRPDRLPHADDVTDRTVRVRIDRELDRKIPPEYDTHKINFQEEKAIPYTIKEIYRFVPRAERGRYSKDPADNSVLGNIRLLLEELEGVPDRSGSLKTDRMYLNNVLDAADGKLPEEKGDAAIRAVNTVIENIYKNQIDNRKLSGDKRERIKDLVVHIAAGLDLAPGLYPVTPAQRDAAKENREAGQRAVQEEITKRGYTDKWIKKHADSLKESERLYRAQGPLPEKRSEENPDGLSKITTNPC